MTPALNGRVLLVSDEEASRHVSAYVLQAVGYQVTECSSMAEARQLVVSGSPWMLLVVDVDMDPRAGVALRGMAPRSAGLPPLVLYLTGSLRRLAGRYRCLDSGEALLERPFNAAALVDAVRILCAESICA